jgi:membrane-associated phospholipid phosphatase
VLVATVTAGAAALVAAVKPLIGRAHPPQIDQLVLETNQSFPSGHAVGAAAVLGVQWRLPYLLVGVALLGGDDDSRADEGSGPGVRHARLPGE